MLIAALNKPGHSSCLQDSRHLSGHGMNFTDKERPTVSPRFQVERQTKAHGGSHEKKMGISMQACSNLARQRELRCAGKRVLMGFHFLV